jgi:hypothetical protein
VTVGRRTLADGEVELQPRDTGADERVALDAAVAEIASRAGDAT